MAFSCLSSVKYIIKQAVNWRVWFKKPLLGSLYMRCFFLGVFLGWTYGFYDYYAPTPGAIEKIIAQNI
jgi:hypothetical protein